MTLTLADLVVDTNVLLHAENPEEDCFAAAIDLLEEILGSETRLCVDNRFDLDKGRNRSMIGWEYLNHLRFGSYAFTFLATMLREQRVIGVPRFPERRRKRIIFRLVGPSRDRTFVGVTCNSHENVLVSHDFRDFGRTKRSTLDRLLGVTVCCSVDLSQKSFRVCSRCSK